MEKDDPRRIALLTAVGQIFVSGTVQVALLVLGVASPLQVHPSGLVMLGLGLHLLLTSDAGAMAGGRMKPTGFCRGGQFTPPAIVPVDLCLYHVPP
jgi:hypothetical protein